jgi:hypothetical protein
MRQWLRIIDIQASNVDIIHLSENGIKVSSLVGRERFDKVKYIAFPISIMDSMVPSGQGLPSLTSLFKKDDEVVTSLSPELQRELDRLKVAFGVDPRTLKEISKRFEDELQDGMTDGRIAIYYY